VQADSIVPNPGNPQSLNRYSYVLGNPLKYIDPSGHAHWMGEGGGELEMDKRYRAPAWYELTPEERVYIQEHAHENTVVDWMIFTGMSGFIVFTPRIFVPLDTFLAGGAASEAGYLLGKGRTGDEIDPIEGLFVFYFGGLSGPEGFLRNLVFGAATNCGQYALTSLAKGEKMTGSNLVGEGLGGAVGTALGYGVDKKLGTLAEEPSQDVLIPIVL
jgi:hypothetical protein